MILNTGNVGKYATFFLKNLGLGELRPVDMLHQLVVAGYFFEQGYTDFRPKVFALARKLLTLLEHEDSCLRELISAGGEAGLQFGLVELCKAENNLVKRSWECNQIYEFADYNLSSVDAALDRIEERHPDTKRFREAVREFQKEESAPAEEQSAPTLEEILKYFDSCNSFVQNYRVSGFGRIASDEQISIIYKRLLEANTEVQQHACMVAFCNRKFPAMDRRILQMLETKNQKLRRACANALSNCSHPTIRRKALQMLQSDDADTICFGLRLLVSNYRPSDAELLIKALKKLQKADAIHSAGLSLKKLYRDGERKELKDCFLWLYENGPESWCRAEFVQTLYRLGICTDEILYESEWDSGSELQEFARNVLTLRELEKVEMVVPEAIVE
jgi:hypothetical protein